jgi:dienelactone hydrolase
MFVTNRWICGAAAATIWTMRHLMITAALVLIAAPARAQSRPPAFPEPAPGIRVSNDLVYASSGETTLRMDVYRPRSGDAAPAFVFFIRAMGPERHQAVYDAWARAAASHGIAAVLPDLRTGHEVEDFDALLAHLDNHARALGLDANRIAVFAASGNVASAFPAFEDPKRTNIKAAVIYYGTGDVPEFRRDLPVLYVRAGLDRPSVNQAIVTLASRAVLANAPLTLVNHETGHHGFELVDSDAATTDTIERTLDFVTRATSPSYQAALHASMTEASAAAAVLAGRFGDAVTAYRALVAAHPDEERMRLSLGEALLGDRQFAAACAELGKLKGANLGARDLGIAAAESCALAGDADAAVAWIASIPPQFRPPDLANDPAFASLRGRADFQALFRLQ